MPVTSMEAKELQKKRRNYLSQLNSLKTKKLRKFKTYFDNVLIHQGVREILGEELAQKFIQDVYKEIQERKGAKICQRKHSSKKS